MTLPLPHSGLSLCTLCHVQPHMLKNLLSLTLSSPLLPRAKGRSSSLPHTYTFPLFRNAVMLDRLKGCPHACLSPPDLSS